MGQEDRDLPVLSQNLRKAAEITIQSRTQQDRRNTATPVASELVMRMVKALATRTIAPERTVRGSSVCKPTCVGGAG